MLEKMETEYAKRDQDKRDMYIYEDWNGWGMSEVMTNMVSYTAFKGWDEWTDDSGEQLKDFNRDIFKKTVSPFRKWSYVEGLALFSRRPN